MPDCARPRYTVVSMKQSRVIQTEQAVSLNNECIMLDFSAENGSLLRIRRADTGFNFLHQPGFPGLWRLCLKHCNASTWIVDSCLQESVGISHRRSEGEVVLELAWNVQLPVQGETVKVKVLIRLPDDSALSFWRIEIEVNSKDYGLWDVTFPIVDGLASKDSHRGQDALSLPWQWGLLVHNPLESITQTPRQSYWGSMGRYGYKYENDYPCQYTMQYFSYCVDGQGLYLATHDSDAYYKTIGFYSGIECSSISYQVRNYPEDMGYETKFYRLPYDAVVGVFSGDWKTASEIYRQWAIQQRWCQLGTLDNRTDIPQWIRETSFWYWNWLHPQRGAPEEIVPAVIDLQKKMNVPTALHWYGWDGYSFNSGINTPYAHPNHARQVALKRATQTLRDNGIRSIPYINARLWVGGNDSWKINGAYAGACKTPEGLYYEEPWAQESIFVAMCPTTSLWRDKLLYMMDDIVDKLGFDGIYVDQVASFNALPCFDSSHDHPLGGGTYWSDGYRDIMKHIRSKIRMKHPDAVFTTESCCETFIDCFDAFLTLDAGFNHNWLFGTNWEPIPLFTAVYHDYAMTYGGVSVLSRDASSLFALEQGRGLCWGSQLMLEYYFEDHFEDNRYQADLDFLQSLTQLHAQYRDFLVYGTWLNGLHIKSPTGKVMLQRANGVENEVNLCLGSAWRKGNDIGIIIGNITNEELPIEYIFDGVVAGVSGGTYEVRESSTCSDRIQGHTHTCKQLLIENTIRLEPREFRFVHLKFLETSE